MKPVAASGGSIVANFDVLDDGEDAAGRTGARLLNLSIVALGLGVIGALALLGRTRMDGCGSSCNRRRPRRKALSVQQRRRRSSGSGASSTR
jgi:hypothetical protein